MTAFRNTNRQSFQLLQTPLETADQFPLTTPMFDAEESNISTVITLPWRTNPNRVKTVLGVERAAVKSWEGLT